MLHSFLVDIPRLLFKQYKGEVRNAFSFITHHTFLTSAAFKFDVCFQSELSTTCIGLKDKNSWSFKGLLVCLRLVYLNNRIRNPLEIHIQRPKSADRRVGTDV